MNKRCIGCGLLLQDQDELEPGYTPNLKNDYCKRCFRLKNYGEKNEETVNEENILKKVNKGECLAFFLVDFLNLNQESISIFNKIKLKKFLVISKSDTLRKEMKKEKIKKWIKNGYKIEEDILFISNKSYYESSNIWKVMDKYNTKKAYIMGITNAGKSTFLNELLKENHIKKEILMSNKPNTTLDFIKIKIGEYTLFDTPGFSYENDKLPIITKEIKPITYQIKENTTVIIDQVRFYFDKKNKITFYGTTNITRKYKKEEGKYNRKVPANSDIVLPGIGFLNIKEECLILTNKNKLEVRLDLSGEEDE